MVNRDPDVLLNWGTPWFPFASVAVYIFLVFTLPYILKPFPRINLKWIVALWNLGLSLFSFCVFWGVILPYIEIYKEVSTKI